MSDKYIIRNCPAKLPSGLCIKAPKKKAYLCQDCTDCVMKQIVELCKIDIQNYSYYDKDYALGRTTEAKRILKLLDIQEVE